MMYLLSASIVQYLFSSMRGSEPNGTGIFVYFVCPMYLRQLDRAWHMEGAQERCEMKGKPFNVQNFCQTRIRKSTWLFQPLVELRRGRGIGGGGGAGDQVGTLPHTQRLASLCLLPPQQRREVLDL